MIMLITFTIPYVNSQGELSIFITKDKPNYVERDSVSISGNVTYQGSLVNDGLIAIEIKNPSSTLMTRTLPLSTNTTEQFDIKISSLYPCNEIAEPIYNVEIGSQTYVWVYMKVINNGIYDRTVYMTISLVDSAQIPLAFKWASVTIKAGKTAVFEPRLYIPNWASLGTATIYADTYTVLPENGGRPLCPEVTSKLNIVESSYSDPPFNETASQPIENGTFNLKFRLPPDAMPGTYSVYAVAWYKGNQASEFTTFNVASIPSPPWPRFKVKPPMAAPNYTITFDASPSSPEGYNDTITSYTWNFGDNQTATGITVTHSYPNYGNYTVTLNVTDNEGFWNTTSKLTLIVLIHDVAIVKIDTPMDTYSNWLSPISVTIKNKGTITETFPVKIYYLNDTIEREACIENVTVNLLETETFQLYLNTTGFTILSNYTINVTLNLPSDINLTNNALEFGPIKIWYIGDHDHDRAITILDITYITGIYGANRGDANWRSPADITPDGKINILDVSKLASVYGKKY